MPDTRPGVLDELTEANYLIGHEDGPKYRLIVRYFYEQYRAHSNYVRSDEIVDYVRQVFPDYDEIACRRHLDQLERWKVVRLLPEQSKPANLIELRQRPRVYQAERLALRLEELRVAIEEEDARAASINPTVLDQLLQRIVEFADYAERRPAEPGPEDQRKAYELWHAVDAAFGQFARGIEDYLSDLPRHKPREALDYLGFLGYRDVITRYLSDYAQRLFQRREYIRYLLHKIDQLRTALAADLAAVAAQQVRADGTSIDRATAQSRYERAIADLIRYFAEGGDVDVLLDRAQNWVTEVTRHARRLSEQHLGSTVREQTLLDLGRRFVACRTLAEAQGLAQIAFGATLPLHWRGEAPPPHEAQPWLEEEIIVPLQTIRRGQRQRLPQDRTVDRSAEEFARMRADAAARAARASELAALFPPDGALDLADLRLASPALRQRLLRLIYRAPAEGGRVSLGYGDWSVIVEPPVSGEMGLIDAPDGRLILPRYRLRLVRGGIAGD